MADEPISGLTAIETVEADDLLVAVDVHDTTMAPTGTDKQMTISQLLGAITGDVSISGLASVVDSTGGIPFVASATTNACDASNITSGTLPAARLPNPSATTLGGVQSAAAVTNQWISSLSTSGVPSLSQPAFSNLSGTATAGQLPALGASGLGHAAGICPDPGGSAGTTRYLREDATWEAPSGGSGTVTSVSLTGDGTVLSSTPSSAVTTSGTLTATLANAGAYTHLANQTSSSAAPTYVYGFDGDQTLSSNTTLSAASPAYNLLVNASNTVAATLPAAATCPGKVFWFSASSNTHAATVIFNAADTYQNLSAGSTITLTGASALNANAWVFGLLSGGSANAYYPMCPQVILGTQVDIGSGAAGGALYQSAGTVSCTAAGTSGQVLQSAGSSAPTWTSTPGSGTPLTSIAVDSVNIPAAAQTTTAGTTAGDVIWSQPFQGAAYKRVVLLFNAYENNTAGNQTITYTTAFSQAPVISTNTTGVTLSSSTSVLTITSPNSTSTFTGWAIVEGY